MAPHLWQRIRDWVTLLVLVGCSLGLMLQQNDAMVRGLRATALEVTARVEARFAWVGHFLQARQENRLLREQNIALSSQLARARDALVENDRLRHLLAFRDSSAFDLLAAEVVSKDITRQRNLLTLNVGRRDSVAVGMPVLDERGILGKVVLVSARYARVMPYLNTEFRVPAKVYPSQAVGVVRWPGSDPHRLIMDYVVKTEPVAPGQPIVTDGSSTIFPDGYPIGTVDSIDVRPGQNQLVIHLTPSASLADADHVFVVRARRDPERTKLETQPIR